MDYSQLSDDQIRQMLGGGSPAPQQSVPTAPQQPAAVTDYSQMSDDQIRQMIAGMQQPDDRRGFFNISEGPSRPRQDIVEDFLTRAASSMTFGQIEKLSAKLGELQGKGGYDELLKKRVAETEAAGQRLGTAGTIAADVTGGGFGAGGLASAGLTVAGRIPQTAGTIAKVLGGTVEGGLYGAAQSAGHVYDPNATTETYLRAAKEGAIPGAIGGAALSAAGAAIPRMITPFPARDPIRAQHVATLEAEGVPLYASQRTGAPGLQRMENMASKMPLNVPRNAARDQMENVTQVVAQRAGLAPGQPLNAHTLDAGLDNIGARIGAVQQQFPNQIDAALTADLNAVTNRSRLMSRSDRSIINEYINRMTPAGATTIDPAAAQALRTDLRLSIQKGPNASAHFNRSIADLRDALDDSLTRTILNSRPAPQATALIGELNQARQQYANMHVLMDALSRSGQAGERGRLTPAALSAAQKSSLGKASYMRGRGDLTEMAKASAGILQGKEGSGTAERSLGYHMMMAPPTLALGLPANALINSRPAQRYWGNQLMPGALPQEMAPTAIGGLLAAEDQRRRGGLLQ